MKFFGLLLLLCLASAKDGRSQSDLTAQDFYNSAMEHAAKKQYRQSILDLTEAIKIRPMRIFYFNRAGSYFFMNKYDSAIIDYKKSLRFIYYDKDASYMIGLCYENLKMYDSGIAHLRTALYVDDKFVAAYYDLGNCLYYKEQYSEAISNFTKAIDLEPTFDLYYARAKAHYLMSQYALAIADFEKMHAIRPADDLPYFRIGNCNFKLKKYGEAIANFQDAIRCDGEVAESHFWLGECYKKLGRYHEAIAEYNKAIVLDNDYTEAKDAKTKCRNAIVYGDPVE